MPDIGATFRALHRPGDPFILANAWDAGSAKVLAALGAEAIGTSSAAHAFTLGKLDAGQVTRDEALAHAEALVSAVSIPVSGDFENGYGDAPEDCAELVRLAAEVGLAGISIEDIAHPTGQAYDRGLAVERIRAAAAAACALPRDFVLCARADGCMLGLYDVDEAIARLLGYQEAGADCLYAPLPPSLDDVKRIIGAVERPVNVLVAGAYAEVPRADYAAMGAARLSLGSALARATHGLLARLGAEILGGDFAGLSREKPRVSIGDLVAAGGRNRSGS